MTAVHSASLFTRALASGLAAAVLAGCGSVGPDYRLPEASAAHRFQAMGPFHEAQAEEKAGAQEASPSPLASAPLPARWWHLFEDPTLDALIQEALQRNADLRVALANLERQAAAQAEARSRGAPSAAVSGGPSFGHVSGLAELQPDVVPPDRFSYSLGAGLSYQLDVVGEIRRAVEAAEADTAAAQAALDLARVNVAAGTARAYVVACGRGRQLQVAQRSIALQEQELAVVQRLQAAGRAGATDVARARALLAQLRAVPPGLQAQQQAALYQLAGWLGRAPGDLPAQVRQCQSAPRVAGALAIGDGAALLRRRPDIRRAERQLAAATARIGVATAQLYPKVTLGLSASSAGPARDFGGSDAFGWSLGPLISWTVPNNGAARARIEQSEAAARMALAAFDGTVLNALREAETALAAYKRELERRADLEKARDEGAEVARQARRLYAGGRSSYLEALDAERSLAGAEAALAASEASVAGDQIEVFMALGGGWEPSMPLAR